MAAEAPAPTRYRQFLKAAGALAAARQLSALVFAGAVLALPLWAPRTWVTDFVWAYFAMLTLTSLLGLGFERLATTVVGEEEGVGATRLSSLVVVRLATIPVAALSLWAMMAFVGVSLSAGAWIATLLWVMATLTTLLGFGGLRARKNTRVEPLLLMATRTTQALLLCCAAMAGATVGLAIAGVAVIEVLASIITFRVLGLLHPHRGSVRGVLELPWRRAFALAGIEVVALAYLRADLLLVSRMLGAGVGAVYGMIYRVLDALTTAIGSVGLWLFAENVTSGDDTSAAEHLRERSLVLLPRLSFAVAIAALLVSEVAADVIGLSRGATSALQLLIAAFPLLAVNSLELHARSGAGRNREVLRVGTVALVVNIVMCLVLITAFGVVGAALALLASETTQSVLLLGASTSEERARVGRSIWLGLLCGALLVATGSAVHAGEQLAAAALLVPAVVIVLAPFAHRRRVPVLS